jgi:hypothetical protein
LITSEFEVFTPQLFPGGDEQTPLSKAFWMQGNID